MIENTSITTARNWHKQAAHDVQMAEKNIGIEGYDVAAFLAQQAVEKLLKAVMILEKKPMPRSHFIDELGELLAVSDEVQDYLLELTPDYMLARYPDVSDEVPFEQYDYDTAVMKVAAAKKVFELLISRYQILLVEENKNGYLA